ncbi:MAG: RNA methyltransferase [Burkholderiaceae bacterium]|nr:RNA methyltransferase [Burkholderiaceae bacterium]
MTDRPERPEHLIDTSSAARRDGEVLRSASNPRFRELLKLTQLARERRKRGVCVIEGEHLLEAYRDRHGAALAVYCCEGARPTSLRGDEPAIELSERLFRQVSQVANGRGPIALVPTPAPSLPAVLDEDTVYLDGIQDPGNVGTILRSCAAAGIPRVVTSADTAFCWSPKVLRAGMGAHFALSIHEGHPIGTVLARARLAIWSTRLDASLPIYEAELEKPSLWLFGSEGEGLSAGAREWPDATAVKIPMAAGVESLNVGAAVAICLFEQRRRRHAGRPDG